MIGALDQKIRIERATVSKNSIGGEAATWGAIPNDPEPFAKVKLEGSQEVMQSGGDVARQRAVFTVRSRDDLLSTDRIVWNGFVWNITGLGRPVARARYQQIAATTGELAR